MWIGKKHVNARCTVKAHMTQLECCQTTSGGGLAGTLIGSQSGVNYICPVSHVLLQKKILPHKLKGHLHLVLRMTPFPTKKK